MAEPPSKKSKVAEEKKVEMPSEKIPGKSLLNIVITLFFKVSLF